MVASQANQAAGMGGAARGVGGVKARSSGCGSPRGAPMKHPSGQKPHEGGVGQVGCFGGAGRVVVRS